MWNTQWAKIISTKESVFLSPHTDSVVVVLCFSSSLCHPFFFIFKCTIIYKTMEQLFVFPWSGMIWSPDLLTLIEKKFCLSLFLLYICTWISVSPRTYSEALPHTDTMLTDCQHSTLWRETVAMAMHFPVVYHLQYIWYSLNSYLRNSSLIFDSTLRSISRDFMMTWWQAWEIQLIATIFQLLIKKWECTTAHCAWTVAYNCK